MLMGEFEHALDSKGRLFVPAKMRENLGAPFVVTKGVDGCLDVYPMEAWEKLKNSFAEKMMPKHKMRDVSRFIFGGACEVEPDKQGRILLLYQPAYLCPDQRDRSDRGGGEQSRNLGCKTLCGIHQSGGSRCGGYD